MGTTTSTDLELEESPSVLELGNHGWAEKAPALIPCRAEKRDEGVCLKVKLGNYFPILPFLKAIGTMTILCSATFWV